MNTKYEIELAKNSTLLILKKTDIDLFILAQAGTVVYRQLDLTGLHGENGGRLSLKRIEKKGYIKSKSAGHDSNLKYYFLTASGKKYIQQIFKDYLSLIKVDLNMKIPGSAYQLPHRIKANDFFYAYMAAPNAVPAVWTPEKTLFETNDPNIHPPRADGYLKLANYEYYIEQDMATQTENIINAKIQQYMDQSILHPKAKCILVFTVSCSPKPDETMTSPYSVYRILLKFIKTWSVYGQSKSYEDIFANIEGEGCIRFLSKRDLIMIRNLHLKFPFQTFEELHSLKEQFRTDTTHIEQYQKKQDNAFQKRFFSHFFCCYDKLPYFKHLLEKGILVYTIPNHRITTEIPFILTDVFCTEDTYKEIIYKTGFDISLLDYSTQSTITTNPDVLLKNTFTSENLIIAIEHIHDLSAGLRVRKLLQMQESNKQIFIIILVGDSNESFTFYNKIGSIRASSNQTSLLFYHTYDTERTYRYITEGDKRNKQYISVYHDFFTGKAEINYE